MTEEQLGSSRGGGDADLTWEVQGWTLVPGNSCVTVSAPGNSMLTKAQTIRQTGAISNGFSLFPPLKSDFK